MSKRKTNAPASATVIERRFKGKAIRVEVTEAGFRCGGKDWKSLTALAMHVTGYKAVSGPAFFRHTKRATEKPPMAPAKAARTPKANRGKRAQS